MDTPSGMSLVPVDTTDDKLIALWLHGRSQRTQKAYQADIARFRALVPHGLRLVTLQDLQDFQDALAHLAPSTQARIVSAVKSLLSFAYRVGYLPINAGAPLKAPKVKNTLAQRIITEAEVVRLVALAEASRDHLLLRLLYMAGLRASEIAALHWCDLIENGPAGQVAVFGKGDKTRHVLLDAQTWHELVAWRGLAEDSMPVFPSRKHGAAITSGQVWRIVKGAAKHAKIKLADGESLVSPHWLRHAHASHALDHGAPISLVRDTLGHASIQTTGRYAHAKPHESSATFLKI